MRRLFIFLFIVLLLLFGADRVSRSIAQREIASKIQNTEDLTVKPKVTVHGFPFLTQALGGNYHQIDGDVSGLTVENGLTIDQLHVELRGVQVKPGDLLSGRVVEAPVDSAVATATVSYPSLVSVAQANLDSKALKVQFAQGSNNRLAVTGNFTSAQLKAEVKAEAKVSVKNGDLVVALDKSTLADLPSVVRNQLTALLSGGYKLPRLPFGFAAKTVTVGPNGITVRATASSVGLG
jgi:hypothetical protein